MYYQQPRKRPSRPDLVNEPATTFIRPGLELNSVLFACVMAFTAGVLFLALLILALKLDLPPAITGLFNILIPLVLLFLFGWSALFSSLRLWHWHKSSTKQSRQYKSDKGEIALVELQITTGTGRKKTVYFNPLDNSFIDPTATVPAAGGSSLSGDVPQWMALRVEEQKTARMVALSDALAQSGSNSVASSTLGSVLAQEYGVEMPPTPAPASHNQSAQSRPAPAPTQPEEDNATDMRIWWLNRASEQVDPEAPLTDLIENRQITAQNLRPELPGSPRPARVWTVQTQSSTERAS